MMRFPHLLLCLGACLTGSAHAITPVELNDRMESGEHLLLVDVRSNIHYAEEHIPGAINIPLDLLPYKKLPTSVPVVVYGDGLGLISETTALAAAEAAGVVGPESLQGGFAEWRMQANLTTALPGVRYEQIPGITYDQLVAADRDNMVIIDLRAPESEEPADPEAPLPASAPAGEDLVLNFAGELNLPVRQGLPSTGADSPSPARSAAGPAPLLVLVADNEASANQAARDLRAGGYHRFTILIGGVESIRHEGRRGMGRQGGNLPIISN